MEVTTANFGTVCADERDIIRFPEGLPGLEDCQRWVILSDSTATEPIGTKQMVTSTMWLQSADQAEIALPIVAPCNFVPDYRVRVSSSELKTLRIERDRDMEVVVVMNQLNGVPSLNLKAPLVINMASRLGRQVVNSGNWSIRHMIASPGGLRRSA